MNRQRIYKEDNKKLCHYCGVNPKSHSFELMMITYENNEYIFYSKLSEAELYYNTESVIEHFKNVLDYYKPDQWSWIFNWKDTSIKHYFLINCVIQLTKLFKNYSESLNTILIIHSSFLIRPLIPLSNYVFEDKKPTIIVHNSELLTRTDLVTYFPTSSLTFNESQYILSYIYS